MITQYRVIVEGLDADHNAILRHDRYWSAMELYQSALPPEKLVGFGAEQAFNMIQSKAAERAAE